jgi:hypothetical protein
MHRMSQERTALHILPTVGLGSGSESLPEDMVIPNRGHNRNNRRTTKKQQQTTKRRMREL